MTGMGSVPAHHRAATVPALRVQLGSGRQAQLCPRQPITLKQWAQQQAALGWQVLPRAAAGQPAPGPLQACAAMGTYGKGTYVNTSHFKVPNAFLEVYLKLFCSRTLRLVTCTRKISEQVTSSLGNCNPVGHMQPEKLGTAEEPLLVVP